DEGYQSYVLWDLYGSGNLSITGNIKRRKSLNYRLLVRSDYFEDFGFYDLAKTVISGKGRPRGNVD
ncbi:hypothetical protein OAK74_00625, partial [bacterium]|nr:hypothetical protein [bacterium]